MTIARLRLLISGALQASFCPTGHLSGTFHSGKEGSTSWLSFLKFDFVQQHSATITHGVDSFIGF